MSPKVRHAVVTLAVLGAIGATVGYFTRFFWYPGLTPRESAEILIRDRKFGFRALERAKNYSDDQIIFELKIASNNFEELDNRNSFWVANLLASKSSTAALSTANDLHASEHHFRFLVGAIALASYKKLDLEEVFAPNSRVLNLLKRGAVQESELALIALGKTKDPRAVPYIVDLLNDKERNDYWLDARGCDALGELGGANAESTLEGLLKDPSFNALPEAFRALVKLGNSNAIPLAIARISPDLKGRNSGHIVNELEQATGENFSYDRSAWEKWWASKSNSQ